MSIRLHAAGIVDATGTLGDQVPEIYSATAKLIKEYTPDGVVIETPATKAKSKAFQHFQGTVRTVPIYGIAVGACICGALSVVRKPILVPSDEWPWKGVPPTMNDRYKQRRVQFAAMMLDVQPGKFGAKTKAGNLADAALIGVWGLGRIRGRVLAFDPAMTMGWAVVEEF